MEWTNLSKNTSINATQTRVSTGATYNYVAEAELKPGYGLGAEYIHLIHLFKVDNDSHEIPFFIGGGFYHEFDRKVKKLTQTVGTLPPSVDENRTEKMTFNSIYFNTYWEILKRTRLILGLSYNMGSLKDSPNADWNLDDSLGIQMGASYTYKNIRAELLYRHVSGDASATGKGTVAGYNFNGDYEYNHVLLSVGYSFGL